MRNWIAFFSQTGREIDSIRRSTSIGPVAIVENLPNNKADVSTDLVEWAANNADWHRLSVKPSLEDYYKVLTKYKDPLITLHGYLRIIPQEICAAYEIYNLHPGLITKYPELKGFNPQQRAFDGKYSSSGCVIHKVIPEVDEGEIISSREIPLDLLSCDEVYTSLHTLAREMWIEFLADKLHE